MPFQRHFSNASSHASSVSEPYSQGSMKSKRVSQARETTFGYGSTSRSNSQIVPSSATYLNDNLLAGYDSVTPASTAHEATYDTTYETAYQPTTDATETQSTTGYNPFRAPATSEYTPVHDYSRARSPPRTGPLSGNRLVIAVDLGTTYTGAAFARVSHNRVASLDDDIALITNWGTGMGNARKIPSVVSYTDPGSSGARQFGSHLSEDAVVMVNTKLELDVQGKLDELETLLHALQGMGNLSFHNVRHCGGHPSYTGKTPETIITFYLTKVFHAFSKYLDILYGTEATKKLRNDMVTTLVITVPAAWSYKAKNATFRAVQNAGFNNYTFAGLNDVRIVSEPAAAALYALRYLKEKNVNFLRPGDTFVLCDAGGGTVDCITYLVTKVDPKLELQQIGEPSCKKCGASYVDGNFKNWLRTAIGLAHWLELDPNAGNGKTKSHTVEGKAMREVMREFEKQKKRFGSADSEEEFKANNGSVAIRLPEEISLASATIGSMIRGGQLFISKQQMEGFFSPCVDATVKLVIGQVEQAAKAGRRVRNTIMIGGFAESPYLENEVQNSMKRRGIELRRPETSWTAVVCGAVLGGVELSPSTIKTKAVPITYGINLTEHFRSTENNYRDIFADPKTRRVYPGGSMCWMIKQGDLVMATDHLIADKEMLYTFSEEQGDTLTLPVYMYDREDLPKRFAEVASELQKVSIFTLRRDSIPPEHLVSWVDGAGKSFWNVKFVCRLEYTFSGSFDAKLLVNGACITTAKPTDHQQHF